MASCDVIRSKKRRLCAGDLDREIQVVDKTLVPALGDDVDYTISLLDDGAPIVWASVSTPRGKTMFDGTGTERDITHVFGVYYESTYTSEQMVLFDGRLFEVLDVNDLDERHEWSLITCTERGTTSNLANR